MTILQINKYFYERGGSEVYFFQLMELLSEKGHRIIPFSMDDKRNRPSPYSSFFVKNRNFELQGRKLLQNFVNFPRFLYSFEAAKKLDALCEKTRPDIAHLHNFTHHLGSSILPVLKRRGIPVAVTLHDYQLISPNALLFDGEKPCEQCCRGVYACVKKGCIRGSRLGTAVFMLETYFQKMLFPYARYIDVAIAPSRFLAEKYRELGFKPKIYELCNFTKASFSHEPTLGKEILFVGRLSQEKGIDVFLSAAKKLPKFSFVVIGNGTLYAQAQKTASPNVVFLGALPPEKTKARMAEARAIVVPSLWYENCPLVILEAMMLGKCVIASNIGGIPELIQHENTGLIFPAGDSDILTAILEDVSMDDEKARLLGDNAQKAANERFNAETHYKGLMKIYGGCEPKLCQR